MLSHSRNVSQARRGFTAIELAAVVGLTAIVGTQVIPAAHRARANNRGLGSATNLMTIGQAAGMYGLDNEDRIPTYSVGIEDGMAGSFDFDLPDGSSIRIRQDADGASAQMTEILQRRTGRIDGEFAILNEPTRLPQRRFTNLVLLDYMDSPLFDPVFIDPADANLLNWAANPLDYGPGSSVPYADPVPAGYDTDGNWTRESTRQRWAFGSSYQAVPAAWQPDGLDGAPVYTPVEQTPHLFAITGFGIAGVELSNGRRFSHVRFPAAKVYQFEEFDREQAGDPYFAYDHARAEKLMFDGSANSLPSVDARPSNNIAILGPAEKFEWKQTYVPLDTFPVPLGGLGDETPLSQRFRWTLGGLRGADYVAPISIPGRPVGRSR
ncbi:MAG: hypothetical protein AAGA55_04775 [Planctomycetota bacterium]